ncbi:MAG: class I mannose-6-phosphate isomerase [Candidatus Sumerlaeota bacterium]|nr:class I mannose-6-phosphate isomerase [Candidatus Sumerlaeota bacterium]
MASLKPYPLLCRPLYQPKIWGGRRLETLFGKDLPSGEKIGESWETADLPEGVSTIANGPLVGRPLADALAQWNGALIGSAWRPPPARFPLLVKLVDAEDDLSIQVHPSNEDCRGLPPGCHGKDESWIILDAEPGGCVLHGFNPGVTFEDFKLRLKEGSLNACLRAVPVRKGDALRVAPGTVHALCRGVVVLEIQQPSDTTFRIYDYGRLGADGKPRLLHLQEAEKVMRFDAVSSLLQPRAHIFPWGRHEIIVDCPAYRIERFDVRGMTPWTVNPQSFQAMFVAQGKARLTGAGETLELQAGDTVVLPAAIGRVTLTCPERAQIILAGASGAPLMSSAAL